MDGVIRSGQGQPLYPAGIYKKYEGSLATAAQLVIDANADLLHDGNSGYVVNDGPGDLLVELMKGNGGTYMAQFTLHNQDILEIEGEGFSKIRLTGSVGTAYYRVIVE